MTDIPYTDAKDAELAKLIEQRESFRLVGCGRRMKAASVRMERLVESASLTCRVRTAGRVATVAAALWNLPVGIAAALGITAHNLATLDPDYEIVRDVVNNRIVVAWQRSGHDA